MLGPTPGHREAWAAGRTHYAVWGIRVSADPVCRRARTVQDALPAGVRPLDASDLHVTVWVGGFPTASAPSHDDDIAEAALERQAQVLAGCRSFRLHVGGTNSFTTAPFLEVTDPDGGLAALRAALGRAGPAELRFAPFLPHLTLGTATTNLPTARVRAALLPHRAAAPLEVGVCQVEQLRFDATRPGAPLKTHCSVDLS